MAVSKRLRYEILRRDDHTCRYCGGKAPDVALTVDHVQPTALGGTDLPENLVAACKDCNSGKTSMKPGSDLVDDVSADAFRWAERMHELLLKAAGDLELLKWDRAIFVQKWERYRVGGEPLAMPLDWTATFDRFNALHVPMDLLEHAIETAMVSTRVKHEDKFRYMCGVIWRTIDKAQEQIAAEDRPSEPSDDPEETRDYLAGFDKAFALLAFHDLPHQLLAGHIDGRKVYLDKTMRWVA